MCSKILLFAAAFLYSGQNTNVGYSCATVKDNERWVKREIYSGRRNCLERFCALTRFCIESKNERKIEMFSRRFLCTNKCYNTTYAVANTACIPSELLCSPYSGLFMPNSSPSFVSLSRNFFFFDFSSMSSSPEKPKKCPSVASVSVYPCSVNLINSSSLINQNT